MTKYYQQFFFLDDIRYPLTKVDIILFLTLAFNKGTIVRTIDLLQTITN